MAGFSHLLAHLDVRQLKSSLEHLLKSLSLSTEIASFTILLLTHHQRSIFDFHVHFLNCVPCHLKVHERMKDCTNINRLLDRPTEVHLRPTQSLGLKYVQICMKIRTFHSWYYFQHSLYNNTWKWKHSNHFHKKCMETMNINLIALSFKQVLSLSAWNWINITIYHKVKVLGITWSWSIPT